MTRWPLTRWRQSLQWRVLVVTLVGVAAALALAGVWLQSLFSEHIHRQFQAELTLHLEQLTARLEFNAQGHPVVDTGSLSDPRWLKPLSGRYWQIDAYPRDPATPLQANGVLRSRSLWDQALELPADVVADGAIHRHAIQGPDGQALVALERTVRPPGEATHRWTLVVAADASDTQAAIDRFSDVLTASLAVLLALLGLASLAQVWVGLSPLRSLQQATTALNQGQVARLQGQFPAEVQPLVDDFNLALQRQEEGLARARTQAGNLAHALKTPLAVLRQAAEQAQRTDQPTGQPPELRHLGEQVLEQVAQAQQHIDWHLRRARSAAHAAGTHRRPTDLLPVLQGLLRVMNKVHAHRGLQLTLDADTPHPQAAIEQEDLHDMLGNLLDNACQWARSRVHIQVDGAGNVVVQDDGPGVPEAQRALMLKRGERLDESTPGSGLGLAIVAELAGLYGAKLVLEDSPLGGLRASVVWPLPATP